MTDFVDEIKIDKITNTAEIFPSVAKFVFLWTLEIVLDKLYGRNSLKNLFFRLIIIFCHFSSFSRKRSLKDA